jgi:hypothetical protein
MPRRRHGSFGYRTTVTGPDEVTISFLAPAPGGFDKGDRLVLGLPPMGSPATGFISVQISARSPLRPSELRRMAWSSWFEIADAALRLGRASPAEVEQANEALAEVILRSVGAQPTKRPGRRGNPKELYVNVARRYSELRRAGERAPIKVIAAEHYVSRNTAAGWIREARTRNLLPSPRVGRA